MDTENKASLTVEIKKLNKVLTRLYKQQTLGYSFARGTLTGLGSVIGATLVFGLIAFLLRNVDLVPIIGSWLSEITSQVIDQLSSGQ